MSMETLDRILGGSGKYHTQCCGKQRSRFVDPQTGMVYCDKCLPPEIHTVQIYKYMYNLCVRMEYIKKYLPSGSDMLTFVNNGKKIVMMSPFLRHVGDHMCLTCRNIVRSPDQYCSVSCVYRDMAMYDSCSDESTPRLVVRKQFCPLPSPCM